MLSKTTKEEQSKDDSSNEKQDAIERRRLQNRLSQRNHRRKIRDRIAKLQERVIASELRAVATLNGWDQASPSAASMIDSKPQGDFDSSPLGSASEDPAISNASQRHVSSSLCRSCCSLLTQMPASPPSPLPFDIGLAHGVDSANSSPSTLLNSSPSSSQLNPFGLDASLSMTGLHTPNEFSYPPYPDPPGSQQYPHCPHYYVATEASLPQIMQTLGNTTSHPKAIVLIPHGSLPPGFSPSPFTGANAADSTGQGLRSALNGNLQNALSGCQCLRQDRDRRPKSSDPGSSGEWMNTNTPSSTPFCPLHPSQSPSLDNFQTMML